MIVQSLGWIAALLGAVVALPQVIRLVRSGTTAGVSVLAWQLTLAAGIAWTMHGVHSGHPNVWAPNVVYLTCTALILVSIMRDRGLHWLPLFGPGLALGLVNAAVDVWLGPLAFAVAALLPSALSQLMQLHGLMLRPNIAGISLPFLFLNVVNQCCWVSWSVLVGEQSVTVVGSTIGSLMAVNLVLGLLRRGGLVRARLAHMWA